MLCQNRFRWLGCYLMSGRHWWAVQSSGCPLPKAMDEDAVSALFSSFPRPDIVENALGLWVGEACLMGGAPGSSWPGRPRPLLPRSRALWLRGAVQSQCRSWSPLAHSATSPPPLLVPRAALPPSRPAPPCPAAARPLLPAGPSRPSGCPPGI